MPSRFSVLFGDPARPADAAFYNDLSTLEIEEHADLPGAIELSLPLRAQGATGSEDLTVVADDRFRPYARIAVIASVENGPDACIFDGCVLSHRVHVDRGVTASSVRVWGQDVSCLLNLEEKVRAWQVGDQIASSIFHGAPCRITAALENSDEPLSNTVMQRATDAQFLRDRARRAGKLFRIACDQQAGDNRGYFYEPNLTAAASATLVLNPAANANVDAIDIEWDVARPSEVQALTLGSTKDAIDGGARDSGLGTLDSRSLATFSGEHAMKVRLTATATDRTDLQGRAQALLREAGWFVKCECDAELARVGSVVRVGHIVQLDGAGRLHSGKYFVWSVRHSINATSHRMRLVLVRNAIGAA